MINRKISFHICITFLVLCHAKGSQITENGECWTACEPRVLESFVKSKYAEGVGMQLFEGNSTSPFRFVSVNAPNLHRLETSSSNSKAVGIPSKSEIWDILCSIQQMGGRVVRTYVLSFGNTSEFHVKVAPLSNIISHHDAEELPTLVFNEAWFEALDHVLQSASTLGIRVILPIINMIELEHWGGAATLARWANVAPQSFFTNTATKQLYKQVINFMLTRVNTLTGTQYRDDPAILGWELGNELFTPICDDLTPPHCGRDTPIRNFPSVPTEWIQDMSEYMRELDPNHLIIDGGYPKDAAVLSLPNVDVMGATYYSGDTAELLDDSQFIAGRKVMLIKEFGLAGSSTLTTVEAILAAVTNDPSMAGALYWSLRGHHDEGGFYWHYEKAVNEVGDTVYPMSLHWPGFGTEAPTYEKSVFAMLQNATLTLGAPAPPISVPCIPTVVLQQGNYFPPCYSLIGSTGAARYELWVSPLLEGQISTPTNQTIPYDDLGGVWFRIQRDSHDAAVEKLAALTFTVDTSVKTLLGWAGNKWKICVSACDLDGNCSPCSAPDDIILDITDPVAPLCSFAAMNQTLASEDSAYLGRFLLNMERPGSWWITVWVLAGISLTTVLVGLGLCRIPVISSCKAALDCYKTALFSRFNPLAADSLILGHESRFEWSAPLAALQTLAILLLIFHCRRNDMSELTWPLSAIAEWGTMSYSFLFLVAGFALGTEQLQARSDAEDQTLGSSSRAIRMWWKRVAHLAPVLMVACTIGFIASPDSLTGSYVLLPLGISAWFPHMWENDVNSPAWVVGALAFNGLVLLPVLDALKEARPTRKTQLGLLGTCWVITLWQANDVLGQRLFLLDRFLIALFLRSFSPSFLGGVLLASLFSQRPSADAPLINIPGRAFTAAGALVLCCLIPLNFSPYVAAWVRSGAMMPLQCVLVWGVASGPSHDMISRLLSFIPPRAAMLGFSMLLLQQATFALLSRAVGEEEEIVWILFCLALPLVAAMVDYVVCRPCTRILLSHAPDAAQHVEKGVKKSLTAIKPRSSTESLVLYYSSIIIIVATFCIAQFYDPWVTVADLTDAAWLPAALEGFSWFLLAPAPALLMGLGGLLLYPAVLQPKGTPLQQQIEQEACTYGSGKDAVAPFKLHFRIVTRGNNPNLVLGNCEAALKVLHSTALAHNRWCVEVVTDKAMHLDDKCDVTEIVVPDGYSPPGGCKFKARALNYAVNASSAGYEDWLIHLDEETRFDAHTVMHIFEHCSKQHYAVHSGASKFPSIGQGVIYYNKAGIENYLTALADTIRVADDYAKFALQYRMFRLPLIGMHGSFVVCCNSLQRDVGWDWGMTGSITEDTYLAMKLAAMGVKFDFCGGNMYEQSPFSCQDFAKQRARWFSGLWLCVVTKTLPFWQRFFLGTHLASWSLCPLLTLLTWVNLLTIFPRTEQFIFLMSFVFSIPFWSYCLGFVLGFSPTQFKHGIVEWVLLLIVHVTMIPVYTIMETYGVARGICDRKTYVGFHIVQKEGNLVAKASGNLPGAAGAGAAQAPPATAAHQPSLDGADIAVQMPNPEENARFERDAALRWWREVLTQPVDPLNLVHSTTTSTVRTPTSRLTEQRQESSSLSESGCKVVAGVSPAALEAFANHVSVSPSAVIAASFSVFLRRYLRQDEVTVGVWHPGAQLDTLPLHVAPSVDATLASLVSSLQSAIEQGLGHASRLTMDDLVVEFGQEHRKLLQATIACSDGSDTPTGASSADRWLAAQPLITDLAVVCSSDNVSLKVNAISNPERHPREAVDRLISSFAVFLSAAIIAGPGSDEPVKKLPLMTSQDRQLAARSFYEQEAAAGTMQAPQTLQQLLQTSLDTADPAAIAILCPGTNMSLTYAQLDNCTVYLARVLRTQYSIGAGDLVVVAAERTVGTVLSLLSIARAGAAYMPVDAAYPEARIRFMLQDARAKLILCSPAQAHQWHQLSSSESSESALPQGKGEAVAVASAMPQVYIVPHDLAEQAVTHHHAATSDSNATSLSPASPSQPAAVLYTSGSTGVPKGVVIPHGAMALQQASIAKATGLSKGDRVAQQTPLTFDVAGNEVWGCVHSQGTLVLVDETSRRLGFEAFIARHAITALFITPSHLGVMTPSACGPALRTLAVAGEAVPKTLIDQWVSPTRTLYNEYGPSETNVVTCCRCSPSMPYPASIGFPLSGCQLLILDESLEPVPPGVAGELCVGGAQLASEYLNRPELTPTKFISWSDRARASDSTSPEPPGPREHRLYRTGDLCRWLPDGSVEFLGRIDSQVKLRGMRVEVGEIESALLSLQPVSQCAVVLTGPPSSAQLVAFVVCHQPANERVSEEARDHAYAHAHAHDAQTRWDERAAKAHLASVLPQHMVPASFQLLPSMPVTSSGKINRNALPALWTHAQHTLSFAGAAEEADHDQGEQEEARPAVEGAGLGALSMGEFLGSERAEALRKRGVDSLGMMREYRALVETEEFAKSETRVLNGIRALCMFGVIVDHLAACAPASPSIVFASKVLFPHAGSSAALRQLLLLLETLLRAVGGYKTIAGFSMTSAYLDAGSSNAVKLGVTEVAVLAIYLEMAWLWDPAVTAAAGAAGVQTDSPWWLAVHRWYLLSMLLSRVAVVVLHALRIPKLAQVLLAAVAMLMTAPSLLCVSSACASLPATSWTDWSAAPAPLDALFHVLFRGIEPQDAEYAFGAFRYVLARKYLLMLFLYLLSFHYGRPAVKACVHAWKRVQEQGSAARRRAASAAAGVGVVSLLVLSSVWLAGAWRAEEDNWVQEWGEVREEAHLTRLGLVAVVLVVQVALMAGAVAVVSPLSMQVAGSTTLGALIAHSYCNVVVSEALLNNPGLDMPPALHILVVLLTAVAIQLFVGPLVYWFTVQHLLLLSRLAARLAAWAAAKCSLHPGNPTAHTSLARASGPGLNLKRPTAPTSPLEATLPVGASAPVGDDGSGVSGPPGDADDSDSSGRLSSGRFSTVTSVLVVKNGDVAGKPA